MPEKRYHQRCAGNHAQQGQQINCTLAGQVSHTYLVTHQRACKGRNQGPAVKAENQLDEKRLRQTQCHCLTRPGFDPVEYGKFHRLSPQQPAEYTGAATLPGIAGNATALAANADPGDIAFGAHDPGLLFNQFTWGLLSIIDWGIDWGQSKRSE
jgi:hypothetical protein